MEEELLQQESDQSATKILKELKESSQLLKNNMDSLHNSLTDLELLSDFYDHTQHLLNWVYTNCHVNNKGLFEINKKEYTWLTLLKAYNAGTFTIPVIITQSINDIF